MRNVNNNKRFLILENKNLMMSIIIISLPIFLSNILKSVHSFVDMYFVSPFGDSATAAISFTHPIIQISLSLAMGLMVAASAIIAQSLGAGDKLKAKKVAGQVFTLNLILGFLFNIILYILTPFIVKAIGSTGETATLAVTYVRIRSFEMIPLFLFSSFLASRQASGDTITPVIFEVVSIIVNIALTWYLASHLQMGLRGAAIATLISHVVIMPVFIILMFKDKKADVYLDFKDLKLDKEEIKHIIKLAVPSSVASTFTSLGFLFINALILSYGDPVMSGFGIGNTINSFVLLPALGVGGSIATFVGQNIGANNPTRAKATVKTGMILTVSIMVIGGFTMILFRDNLSSIFLTKGTISHDIASIYMFYLAFSLPLMAMFQVLLGSYQGAGYTNYVFLLSSFRLWGMRLPLAYLYRDVFHIDSTGVMVAMVLSNFASVFLGFILYNKIRFDRTIMEKAKEQI